MSISRKFSEEEDAFITANYSSMSSRDIAIHLDRSEASIFHRVQRLGLIKHVLRRWTEAEDEIIRTSIGRKLADVARELERRESEVSSRARVLGLGSWRKRNGYRPDNHGRVVIAYERKNGHSIRVMEHRRVVENDLGRNLTSDEIVHHIDLNKTNNGIGNLFLCASRSQHKRIHNSFEQLLPYLLERGIVCFDRDEGIYRICETSK